MINQLLACIAERNPMHATKVVSNLDRIAGMRDDLDRFLHDYAPFMQRQGIDGSRLCDAYLAMVGQMTEARLDFARTGKYATEFQEQAIAGVYSNAPVMTEYMLGLGLSQFLWRHHYLLFDFYRTQIASLGTQRRALEVGSGHGLFLLEFVSAHPELRAVDVVDISETSLELTASLLATIRPDLSVPIRFIHSDVAAFGPEQAYDFVTMGEVLEHVRDPGGLLASMKRMLKPGGTMFISTCANCPTIDHIYHFKTVDEIRQMIVDQGLRIEHQIVVASEDLSDEDLRRYKMDILYGAILSL